jgi:hypothetical protein
MKSAYAFKFVFAVAFGVLLGEYISWDYARWHMLGRDAFLTYQGHRFDRYMAHPVPGALHVIFAMLMVVGLLTLYEVAAYLGAKCVSLIVDSVRHQ